MAVKQERLTSPKGVAKYPRLTVPDTKFKPEGEYRVTLLVPAKEASEFCLKLDTLAEEAFQKAKEQAKPADKSKVTRVAPYAPAFDDAGVETGDIEFKFKAKAAGVKKDGTKWAFKPSLYDATGTQISGTINVGGGSTLRVNFTPSSYYVAATKQSGIALYINAVQVIELKEYTGGGDAASMGFEKEEGYVAPAFPEGDVDNRDY